MRLFRKRRRRKFRLFKRPRRRRLFSKSSRRGGGFMKGFKKGKKYKFGVG